MSAVAAIMALVLAGLAGLHIHWALGGVWPGTDARSCARATAGFRGIDTMPPPAACLAVAACLLVAAGLALTLAGLAPALAPALLLQVAAAATATVFLARGAAGYTPAWRRLTPEMPFARNDRRWYSPLCLLIGTGFVLLVLQGVPA